MTVLLSDLEPFAAYLGVDFDTFYEAYYEIDYDEEEFTQETDCYSRTIPLSLP